MIIIYILFDGDLKFHEAIRKRNCGGEDHLSWINEKLSTCVLFEHGTIIDLHRSNGNVNFNVVNNVISTPILSRSTLQIAAW